MRFVLLALVFASAVYAVSFKDIELVGFSWDSCGSASDPIVIKQLNINPSPIVLGQNVTANAIVAVTTKIQDDPEGTIQLTLEKKVGVWIPIPCVDNLGSCQYNDACALLNQVTDQICPVLQQFNIPCACPFPANQYVVPAGTEFPTRVPPNIPSWLESGSYYAKVVMTDSSGQLGCYEFYVDITVPSN